MSDKCSDCFIHHDNEPIMCEKCGQKSMNYKWNEPCVTWTCSNCGYSVVGSGFWAPCSLDETEYKIKNLSDKEMKFTFGVEQVFAFSEMIEDDMREITNKKVWERKDKNLGMNVKLTSSKPCDYWVVPINTVSTSENGYEKTYQGTTVVNVYKFVLNKNNSFSFKIKTEVLNKK